MYRSYYSFDETFHNHVKETKSVKGFNGLIYLDNIIIDVDKGEIHESSFQGYLINCITDLLDKGVMSEDINVWFSGSGYHIYLKNIFGFQPSKELNTKLKLTMSSCFDFGDSIYDKTRIIRSDWSLNNKTGLYKVWIPLELIGNMTYEEVKNVASSKTNYNKWSKTLPDFTNSMFKEHEDHVDPYLQSMIVASPTIVIPNGNTKKGEVSTIVSCMQHVFNEGPVKGSRNMKLMRMVSSYKRAGVPYLVTLNGMLTWSNDTLAEDEVTRSVTNVYEGNYSYSCNDHIMSEYCDPKCIYFKRKDYTLEINSIDELESNLRSYINTDLIEKSINMGDLFKVPDYRMKPGELVVFSGDTGMGKSAFVQYIVTKALQDVIYLSLEMKEELTFRRFAQIATDKDEKWINEQYKNNPDFSLTEQLKHIKLMSIAPRVDAVKKIVAEYQPTVLVIDTIDELQVDFSKGEVEKQNIVIDNLKQIAQRNNIIIVCITHLNKASAATNVVSLHSLKGSSNIVQKADKVLVIKGERNELVRTITSEKSRDEGRFEMTAFFEPETMTFRMLT